MQVVQQFHAYKFYICKLVQAVDGVQLGCPQGGSTGLATRLTTSYMMLGWRFFMHCITKNASDKM